MIASESSSEGSNTDRDMYISEVHNGVEINRQWEGSSEDENEFEKKEEEDNKKEKEIDFWKQKVV